MNIYDVVGVGVGPFNLSLAALIEGSNHNINLKSLFLEKKDNFEWHDGMLIEDTTMQTHFLKDLVTPIDPSNKFSFLQYLKNKNLFYHFLHRKKWCISRLEFNDYMQWCVAQLENLKFSSAVIDIELYKNVFKISTQKEQVFSKHIVLGTGIVPNIPIKTPLDDKCFHTSNYLKYRDKIQFKGKRIVVIGGSQSGAEVVKDILTKFPEISELSWIEKNRFNHLQESCFDNELYSPHYALSIHNLPRSERLHHNNIYYATSNGITLELADELYHILYSKKFLENNGSKISLMPHRSVNSIKKQRNFYLIESKMRNSNENIFIESDVVILATGYKSNHISLLKNLLHGVKNIEELEMNNDYSVRWHHSENKIFLQNGLQSHFGIPDANISLAAWRSGRILDRLINKPLEDLHEKIISFDFQEKNQIKSEKINHHCY